MFQYLKNNNIPGVKDVIPAYTSVTAIYDIMQVKAFTGIMPHTFIANEINNAIAACNEELFFNAQEITIPVCYDISLGTNLEAIAQQKNISIEEVINIHTATVYDIYMIGFLPGFAYMGFVDEAIATPRLSKPRMNVAAGSVGIAGNQTGIYPFNSPGGWNIIGQTPLKLFNAEKENPCLLKPGDKIKFSAISLETFNQLKQA